MWLVASVIESLLRLTECGIFASQCYRNHSQRMMNLTSVSCSQERLLQNECDKKMHARERLGMQQRRLLPIIFSSIS